MDPSFYRLFTAPATITLPLQAGTREHSVNLLAPGSKGQVWAKEWGKFIGNLAWVEAGFSSPSHGVSINAKPKKNVNPEETGCNTCSLNE